FRRLPIGLELLGAVYPGGHVGTVGGGLVRQLLVAGNHDLGNRGGVLPADHSDQPDEREVLWRSRSLVRQHQ
ncbi:hypothetical protein OH705_28270, partial [Pseudomonas sp. BJa3]|nr:hypothetical protein [Pseudomonas sp. BJa3]